MYNVHTFLAVGGVIALAIGSTAGSIIILIIICSVCAIICYIIASNKKTSRTSYDVSDRPAFQLQNISGSQGQPGSTQQQQSFQQQPNTSSNNNPSPPSSQRPPPFAPGYHATNSQNISPNQTQMATQYPAATYPSAPYLTTNHPSAPPYPATALQQIPYPYNTSYIVEESQANTPFHFSEPPRYCDIVTDELSENNASS